ncbi:MAG TPA: hypothetical protein VI756_16980 [Blastocatellia bacterium]
MDLQTVAATLVKRLSEAGGADSAFGRDAVSSRIEAERRTNRRIVYGLAPGALMLFLGLMLVIVTGALLTDKIWQLLGVVIALSGVFVLVGAVFWPLLSRSGEMPARPRTNPMPPDERLVDHVPARVAEPPSIVERTTELIGREGNGVEDCKPAQ